MPSFRKFRDTTVQTGTTTTDGAGSVTVSLGCFRPDETPCVTFSSFGPGGNSNVIGTNLTLVGGVWQVQILTSAPGITVLYHAFVATATPAEVPPSPPTNLITQDEIDIITQSGLLITVQEGGVIPFVSLMTVDEFDIITTGDEVIITL